MAVSRRTFVGGSAATILTACSGGIPSSESGSAPAAVPNSAFDAWVARFLPRARAKGVSQNTLSAAFAGVGYLPEVIERDRRQAEFTRSLEDYLAIVASDDRVGEGRASLRRHGTTLAAIEGRYGVDHQVVAAIWGVESRYGTRRGNVPVISAISTLAFDGRRGAFFEEQLIAALRILQAGDTVPSRMTGSWAGAMGHTQFIPTSYLAYAVDFTGDGRRDIWSDDPSDALASTAAYLRRSGWQPGRPWGMEVRLPAGFDTSGTGRGNVRGADVWASRGVTTTAGRPLPNHGPAAILLPQGTRGPAFATFRNFNAILRYNNAVNYGIGVGYLADRIAGAPPLQSAFPPDAQGLTIDDRREIQRRLTARGFDTQGTDGVIGPDTATAIRAFEAQAGLPVTGEPTRDLLSLLR